MVNSASGKRLEMFVHERVDVSVKDSVFLCLVCFATMDKLLKTTVMFFFRDFFCFVSLFYDMYYEIFD